MHGDGNQLRMRRIWLFVLADFCTGMWGINWACASSGYFFSHRFLHMCDDGNQLCTARATDYSLYANFCTCALHWVNCACAYIQDGPVPVNNRTMMYLLQLLHCIVTYLSGYRNIRRHLHYKHKFKKNSYCRLFCAKLIIICRGPE